MLQVKSFTAALDSFRVVVDLEQEEYVMLVYLRIISLNELVDFLYNLVLVSLDEAVLLNKLSLVVLVQIEVAFQKPMVQV